MSIRIRHCLVIACDECGAIAEHPDDDGGTPHFDTIYEANEWLSYGDDEDGWLVSAAERICPTCRAKRACALVGHDWSEWWEYGTLRGLRVAVRTCHRYACPAREEAPAMDGAQ